MRFDQGAAKRLRRWLKRHLRFWAPARLTERRVGRVFWWRHRPAGRSLSELGAAGTGGAGGGASELPGPGTDPVVTVDDANFFGTNLSGLHYQPAAGAGGGLIDVGRTKQPVEGVSALVQRHDVGA